MRPLAAVAPSQCCWNLVSTTPYPKPVHLGNPPILSSTSSFCYAPFDSLFAFLLQSVSPRSLLIAEPGDIDSADEQSEGDSVIQLDCLSRRVCSVKKMIEALRFDQRPTSKESGYACLVSCMWSFDAEGKLRFSCTPKRKFRGSVSSRFFPLNNNKIVNMSV
jgi:hypothetical protein